MVGKRLPLPAAELQETHNNNSLVAESRFFHGSDSRMHEDQVVIGQSMAMSGPPLIICMLKSLTSQTVQVNVNRTTHGKRLDLRLCL